MFVKKVITALFAALVLFSFSSNAYAEFFSVSAGIPFSQSFSQSWENSSGSIESDGVSGILLHVKLPIMLGLGLETYETKITAPDTNFSDMKLKTTMYDVFWMTPIPIINFTIGGGLGTTTLECNVETTGSCSDSFEAGTASQLWAQLGFSPIPFLDVHMSYHNISSTVKGIGSAKDEDFSGSLMAVGVAFIF